MKIIVEEVCTMKSTLCWSTVYFDGNELKGDVEAFTQEEIQIYRAAYMTWRMQNQFPSKPIGGV